MHVATYQSSTASPLLRQSTVGVIVAMRQVVTHSKPQLALCDVVCSGGNGATSLSSESVARLRKFLAIFGSLN